MHTLVRTLGAHYIAMMITHWSLSHTHMHAHWHACVHTAHTRTHTQTHTHTHTYTHANTHTHTHTHMHTQTHTHTHSTHTCIQTHTHTYTHTQHTHMHTNTHTQTHIYIHTHAHTHRELFHSLRTQDPNRAEGLAYQTNEGTNLYSCWKILVAMGTESTGKWHSYLDTITVTPLLCSLWEATVCYLHK